PRVHDLLALGLAHALHDHLLRGLGGDAAEVDVLDLLLDVVADLDALGLLDRVHQADLAVGRLHHSVVGHHFPAAEGLVAAVLGVDLDAGYHVLVDVALLGRCGQGGLEGFQDHRLGDALLMGDRVDDQQQFLAHLLYHSARDGFCAAGLLSMFLGEPALPLPCPAPRPLAPFAGPKPSAAQSGTRRALSMLSTTTVSGWPSTSKVTVPSPTAAIRPCSRRRPSCGSFRPTLACSPRKRSKCASVNSGRSTPGDDTSRV